MTLEPQVRNFGLQAWTKVVLWLLARRNSLAALLRRLIMTDDAPPSILAAAE